MKTLATAKIEKRLEDNYWLLFAEVRYAPPRLRKAILKRDHYRCQYCGRSVIDKKKRLRANIDHVEPYHRGGPTLPSNLVTACPRCNKRKNFYVLTEKFVESARARKFPGAPGKKDIWFRQNPFLVAVRVARRSDCSCGACEMLRLVSLEYAREFGEFLEALTTYVIHLRHTVVYPVSGHKNFYLYD